MRVRAGIALLVLALFASACTLRRPDVTLTLAPIETDTPEATDITEAPTTVETATRTLNAHGNRPGYHNIDVYGISDSDRDPEQQPMLTSQRRRAR